MKREDGCRGGMMLKLGGVLVDVGALTSKAALPYLRELRERLGATVPFDVRSPREDLPEIAELGCWLKPHPRALAIASARAAERGHLVVVFAPLLPDAAVVQGLLSAFELDELIGLAQPRFADAASDDIWSLPGGGRTSEQRMPRQTLPLLPARYVTSEHLAACVVIRREVLAGIALDPNQNESLVLALLHEMRMARRRGYRTLIMNHLVVPSTAPRAAAYLLEDLPSGDDRVGSPRPVSADEWFDGGLHRRREALAAKASRAWPTQKVRVLLDCRGAVAHHNGTSEAIFGVVKGVENERPDWEIDLLFTPEAAVYHQVVARFPAMRLRTALPDVSYAAAVCLNQPWHLSTVKQLHHRALTIAFNILDTIAWDVVYLSNPEVDRVWNFIAEHADGLVYISAFSQRRFNFRFPVVQSVRQAVAHLSLAAKDYRESAVEASPEGDHILVFGNHYDHKAVAPTLELLSRAFPFQRIQAVGAKAHHLQNVTVLQSGHLPALEIDRLISSARIVVFPSFYEGFGLPVIKALAYGRTVVVRSSSLWNELAGLMRMPGTLVDFVTPPDLVEVVGQVLAGEPPKALPLGRCLADGEDPPGWDLCARHFIKLVEATLSAADAKRWYARDRALALASQ